MNVLSENDTFYMGAMSVPGRRTILHAAVSHRMPSRLGIEFLLKQEELSINDTDSDGKTPIMYYLCANKYQQSLLCVQGMGVNIGVIVDGQIGVDIIVEWPVRINGNKQVCTSTIVEPRFESFVHT